MDIFVHILSSKISSMRQNKIKQVMLIFENLEEIVVFGDSLSQIEFESLEKNIKKGEFIFTNLDKIKYIKDGIFKYEEDSTSEAYKRILAYDDLVSMIFHFDNNEIKEYYIDEDESIVKSYKCEDSLYLKIEKNREKLYTKFVHDLELRNANLKTEEAKDLSEFVIKSLKDCFL